ncbi:MULTISPECIES: teichoic acids export ABC transporter ATP-binding subunit TagH [Clostridium]|jgi:ABC-type polysaccharide/polyol phosphate transport system ATPase subunit|uniref:Teichoic acids export ABC transporter ATP-binding subunit TagH n=1 Tax=Clostridium tertium TaxID=1559 RepID=A0A9X4B2F2_9CLOT|nr:teichoic acids export ABC transporter ATP-binding subunit TagH [Clostridium sp.]MDC4240158.1 teichoic acids export ABC transporter ATP-binding subunit TagH [Clostridium tertium]MDU2460608.1 teichoic acids export ABC transporter ATP-binding subunit TagH [Clostridium sp.]MDU7363215.1 teichoic acids export ABC transporter ATP-binding subunit TagH [Clostridium sp.]
MEENKYSIIAKNISKGYKMYSSPKEKLLDLILPKGAGKTFYALKDISFKVEKGDVVGLLGLNGSGKSTLSNILGGVSMPTSGEIEINGEASLIAIGIGMNNFLSGIENIELKALMMGYKKDEIEEIKQEIIDFADIGEFINQPLRTYSSGMRSRLGFAISVYTNPDILVIDEALSVGDPTFTQKCLDKMNEFKESGKTIFFVSHSLPQIRKFCNKAIWLEYGRLREYGDVDSVLPKYQGYINEINKMSEAQKVEYKKNVLKNQEHSLLKDFKLVDNNLKKFVPKGKVIKSVTLINNENIVKEEFFNIDLSTFSFGFIPSIIRKRYENAIFILILQILNFLIVSFPYSIITNFIVTGIVSIFTSRGYIDYLIEEKKFIPYNIWEKINSNEGKKVKNKIHNQNKVKKLIAIASILFVAFASVFSVSYTIKKDFAILNSEKINVKDYMIIVTSNVKNEETIDSLLILNSKGSESLNGVVYPGKIQVSYKNNTDQLSKLANLKDIDGLKKILENNFKVKVSDYIVINKEDLRNKDAKYIEIYEEILSNILTLEDKDFEKKVDEIIGKYPQINKELLNDFYNDFNNKQVSITEVKYKTVLLRDLVEVAVLQALDMTDKGEYEFITIDTRILQNNSIIKNINKKYEEYLNESPKDEVIENEATDVRNDLYEDIDEPILNNQWEAPPSNSGGTTEIPPSNSGGESTEVPPSNNGGGTTEIPPSNNGGETTETPPSNNGEGTTETPPSNNGEGTTEIPPSGDENVGGVEIPPSNNENS